MLGWVTRPVDGVLDNLVGDYWVILRPSVEFAYPWNEIDDLPWILKENDNK